MKKKFEGLELDSDFKKKNVKPQKKDYNFFDKIFGFKKASDKKFKNISSKGGRINFRVGRFRRLILIVFKIFICCTLIAIIGLSIVVTGLTVYFMKASDNPIPIKLDKDSLMGSADTVVMGVNDDNEYVPVSGVSKGAKGIWVDSKNVPDNLKNAIIAIEDRDFLKHQGVNWKRTFAASANFVLHFWNNNQGGSTITQQLIKNLTNDRATRGVEGAHRKIREVYRALSVERSYSKDQIMQAYLNIAHIGGSHGNFKGVGAAAKLYFNKEVSELDLAECATIASTIRNPTYYDPTKNPENNKARRDKTLKNMLNLGFISREEFEKAVNKPVIAVNRNKRKNKTHDFDDINITNHQSYFVDSVLNQVVHDYMKLKKISDWDKANDEVKNSGFKIYSTIDSRVQQELEKIFSNPSNFGCKSFEKKPNAACVIYDFNGNMKACVGNLGKKRAGDRADLNFATSIINPGSCNKPFIYSLAIKNDLLTYSSVVEDSPVRQIDSRDWPKNYDNKYHGDVTVQYALENSLNTVPVKIVRKLGVESVCNFLINGLKFSTIYPPSKPFERRTFETEALAIGSMTKGIKLNELTNAFQIFGNGGYLTPSTTYEKVCNSSGELIIEPKREPVKVIDSETSAVLNRLLRRVVTHGTGKPANLDSLGIEVVGKTGTSDDEKSLSFVGLIPPTNEKAQDGRIVGIWVGGKGLMKPTAIFKMVCSKIFKSKTNAHSSGKRNFEYLNRFVEECNFCKHSGQLAGINCPTQDLEIGYYKKKKLPNRCTLH